jgi:predicted enzyme related to lactoylglutathione lyase
VNDYPAGVPCWVEALGPHPRPEFYGALFGWEVDDAGIARLDGRTVAGLTVAEVAAWNTYVRVDSAAEAAARAETLVGPMNGMAVLRDPAGAVISVHEALGAERVNEPGAWQMSSLHTTDTEGAKAFYGELFGWVAEPLGPITVFRLPGYAGEAGPMLPPGTVALMAAPDPSVPTHWNVNFRVGDADAAAALAAEHGGRVLMAPFDTPGFRNAVLLDPNGAAFTVSHLRD